MSIHARLWCLLFSICLLFCTPASAAEVPLRVAAASSLKFVLDELVRLYGKEHPEVALQMTYGASGKLATQIRQGAPFDLFLSADKLRADDLWKQGLCISAPRVFARGRLVLWSRHEDVSKLQLADLRAPRFSRIAIANPRHAPYGQAARQAMKQSGVWSELEDRLVFGENIAQATQFVRSGNAQVGITALSLAVHPELASEGGYALVPESMHQSLEQVWVVMKASSQPSVADQFARFLQTPAAQTLLEKSGFSVPVSN
tara:strand:- start:1926 stop:2702 length:777 start_codon:yes stop_codon:yes gene_type:complete